MNSKEITIKIAQILNDKKGEDIKIFEVKGLTSIGDYFILCNGISTPHIKSLSDATEEKLKEFEILPLHIEGYSSATWILMDYGDVVVHIFNKEAASFYDLERLWSDAPRLNIELQ